ncbi:HIT-like domain [Pseudocohnilembus persalinus]|uniref:HIT-like domain n=1 Tax=Pseudocohnilembus persalinus TaxID=266149 RepID=A0A0V0QVY9_PSEPJ|nr:HIT-like domain [Pseudocohnilembus persalinus]|eukprot:KRX06395.1 HIT-like domain [Pseudocohnilembus persalinus]
MAAKKFLVCGDVEGNFDTLNHKINQLIKKGQNFDFLICVGNTFSLEFNISDYIKGKKKFPIKTYFIDSSELSQCLLHKYPVQQEICENFTFLGRAGLINIQGLEVCFISGVQSHSHPEFYHENHVFKTSFTGPFYNKIDIELIEQEIKRKGDTFKGVDLLLSSEWPYGIEQYLDKDTQKIVGGITDKSLKIAQISDMVCPRYHFASKSGIFFQRSPYLNRKKHLTRFIAFGKVADGGEQKYLSAYQVTPISQMTEEELAIYTDDTTQNPFHSQDFLEPYKQIEEDEIEDKNLGVEGEDSGQEDILQKRMRENEANFSDEDDKNKGKMGDSNNNRNNRNQSNKIESNVSLYVGQFDTRTSSDDIAEFLARWGQIEELELVYDEKTRKHKGFGFVKFANLQTTQSALNESGVYSLHGRKINFKPKGKGSSSGNDAICWFCYNSPDIDESLIFYRGNEVYCALDKGPVTDKHFLIIPKDHFKNTINMSKQGQQEIEELKVRINKIFMKLYNKTLICYERYMKLSDNKAHTIIQCVPVQISETENFRQKFENGVRAHRIEFFKMRAEESVEEFVSKNEYYFYLELFGKEKYLYVFKEGVRFHYDFGRQIICEIFKIPRANWKDCVIGERQIEQDRSEMSFLMQK